MVVPTSNSLPESDSSERKVEEHTSVASGFCRSEFGEDSNMEVGYYLASISGMQQE